jgi:hypothetical protein
MTKNTELNRDLIMAKLSNFYANKDNMQIMTSVVEGKSSVSLRLIDWFVTNFCKNHASHYQYYTNYRSQLKAFSKHNFDPFKRRDRIKFYYQSDKYIITTIGQLNFFKWAIETNVVTQIRDNLSEIEADMAKIPGHHKESTCQSSGTSQENRTVSFD